MSNKGHSKEYSVSLIKRLREDGWYLFKQKGGHRQFKHPIKKGKVTVPYHITKNIELSVMRQAGLRKVKNGRIQDIKR